MEMKYVHGRGDSQRSQRKYETEKKIVLLMPLMSKEFLQINFLKANMWETM